MDRVHAELLGPRLVMELRQEAGRQLRAAALAPIPWRAAPVASFGRLPIRAGERLKRVECPHPVLSAPGRVVAGVGRVD